MMGCVPDDAMPAEISSCRSGCPAVLSLYRVERERERETCRNERNIKNMRWIKSSDSVRDLSDYSVFNWGKVRCPLPKIVGSQGDGSFIICSKAFWKRA